MNERKDERWLDDQLRRVVNAGRPEFDAESWKGKHRTEYEVLLSRRGQPIQSGRRVVVAWWIARLAIAAVVFLAVVLFIPGSPPAHGPERSAGLVADSAAEMMTMRSLRMAYEEGGFDGLDRQLQNTLDEFGPRSSSVSLRELF